MTAPSRVRPAEVGHSAFTRRTLVKGAAWATPVAALSLSAPAMALSVSCSDTTLLDSQARARMLSGQIGGANLDVLAEVDGVHAQAFDPPTPGADGSQSDLKANPLTVEALSAIQLNLGGLSGALTTVLDFVAGQDAGVLNEYAYANEQAQSALYPEAPEVGGAGAVSNDGTIAISVDDPNPPALGTINLYSILQQATGPGVAELVDLIAGLDLQIGAAAGTAELDYVCNTARGVSEETIDRDYLIAYLKLVVESGLVGPLLEGVTSGLEGADLGISTNQLLDALRPIPVLGPLIATIGSAVVSADIGLTVNTDQLLAEPIPADPNAALRVDPVSTDITLDLASLLGGPYDGAISPFLNNRAPNTRLFVDAELPSGGVTAILDDWVEELLTRLMSLTTVNLTLTAASVLRVQVNGTLAQLLDGQGTASVQSWVPLLGWQNLLGVPLGDVLEAVGGVVSGAVTALFDSETGLLRGTLDSLNGLLSVLFNVLSGVLAITVNAQNNATGTMPSYYAAITPERRYDVSALHLEVLGMLNLLDLAVARGSVGQNEFRAGA